MLKLHVGCGDVHLNGYVNIDSRYQPGVDRVDNIGILKRYSENSVDEIYACHCLDHFSRWEYPRVLKRWFDLLVPGGVLKISTIDFHAIVELYEFGKSLKDLIGCLVAAQDYDSNVRRMHWNYVTLDRDLKDAGFSSVTRLFVPFEDDCSSAKIDDILISLNVRAQK